MPKLFFIFDVSVQIWCWLWPGKSKLIATPWLLIAILIYIFTHNLTLSLIYELWLPFFQETFPKSSGRTQKRSVSARLTLVKEKRKRLSSFACITLLGTWWRSLFETFRNQNKELNWQLCRRNHATFSYP